VTRTNYTLAILAVLAASALGVILAFGIPSAVFPEMTFNRMIVLADSGDLPPEQMLVSVTRPLESAAYGVAGVSLVRSTTSRGSAEIDVTFSQAADIAVTAQRLNAAMAEARGRLPDGTEVEARLLTSSTFPIVDTSLSSKTRSLAELTDIALYDVMPSFHRIAGAQRVEVVGGKYREFVIRLDPARLMEHELSAQDVIDGLAKVNVIASAGRMLDSHRMLLTIVTTDLRGAQTLAGLTVATLDGTPVHISDVGTVELGIREDYIRTASENGPAVLVSISRQVNANTEQIAHQARELIGEFQRRYPDVEFSMSYDQSTLVQESFRSVRDAIVLGLTLAVLIVLIFTRSLTSAIIAALVAPCTIAITFAVMRAANLTFNMMTLGGLAAGIGLFIDDAIVMIEAIHRGRAGGTSTRDAVPAALHELSRPLVASTLTVIVVFLPLIFMSSITGVFFRALALTLGAGLAVSLALALYFTPALEMAFAPLRRRSREAGRIFDVITRSYVIGMRPFVSFPPLALLVTGAAIILTIFIYRSVGTDYLPALDEGAFVLDFIAPPESTPEDTEALMERIDQVLMTTPEVAAFSRRTGTQLGFFLTESNRGDISVRLKPHRNRDIDQIVDSVRDRITSTVPGVNLEFSQMLQDLIGDLSGVPEPIEVKIFGSDQNVIETTARNVAMRLRTLPGLVDVFDGVVLSLPEQEVIVDETAASRYGLTPADIYANLRIAIQGTVATHIRQGDRLMDVRVRYPDSFHDDLSSLSEVLVHTANKGRVPISAVTHLQYLGAHAEMNRERMLPVVRVTARLENIDLGTAMAEVRKTVGEMTLPAGVSIEYGGLYAQQEEAFGQFRAVLLVGVVVMFLVLVWEFRRLTPALSCLVAATACLAGSFLALELTGISLNISSFMGIIMVAGITAKNGILLLDHAEHDVAAGKSPQDALLSAARIRLRPILMTTLATAAGLFPLALGLGAGAKVQQPLSVAVIGGLIFAMLLSTQLAGGLYLLGTRQRRPGSVS
jgi:CzcA family heavy metal efflux pump